MGLGGRHGGESLRAVAAGPKRPRGGVGGRLVPPLQRGTRRSSPAPRQRVQVGSAQRRRHLLPHYPADAVPGPEIFPVPFVPGRPRPGLGQGEVRAGRPAGSGPTWPALRRHAPGSQPYAPLVTSSTRASISLPVLG